MKREMAPGEFREAAENAVLGDVRTAGESESGRIAGADSTDSFQPDFVASVHTPGRNGALER